MAYDSSLYFYTQVWVRIGWCIIQKAVMRPISKLHSFSEAQAEKIQSQKLCQLRKLQLINLKAQQKLKKIRDTIRLRMQTLDEFISTYRLKTEYPPASGIISYLKFQRNTPYSLREQSRVIEQQEAIKNTTQSDCEFMKKLNNDKPVKKRKDIDLKALPSRALQINFVEVALASNYKTGIELYKLWLEYHQKKIFKSPFDRREEQLIIQKQKIYGDNWEKVCQFIQTRTFEEIYYQFHNRLNPKIVPGRWTLRQSLMLIVLCEHYGVKKWALIAQKMAIKSELQVRERYCNIIDPSVGKNIWTTELEQRLLDVAVQMNYCWKQIAKLQIFKDKTDNCIWRKYRNMLIWRQQQQIYRLMPGGNKKGLIDKIIKFKRNVEAKKKGTSKPPSAADRMSRQLSEVIPSHIGMTEVKQGEVQEQQDNNLSYIIYD